MNAEAFRGPIGLHPSVAGIAENIHYIRKELPSLAIPQIEQSRIGKVCEDFEGALYDVRKEIRNLEDKLGMHVGEEPFDSDIQNPDPLVTISLIDQWLRTEIKAMHQTVLHLAKISKEDHELGCAFLLVAESATNVLSVYSNVQESLSCIRATFAQTGA